MVPGRRRGLVAALGLTTGLLAAGGPLAAHETKGVGALRLTIGWGDEPAFSGLKNSVEVDVADASGAPVSDPAATLRADVVFGEERVSVQLGPARGQPGKFRASIIPTRPGVYAFQISGTVKGQAINTTSTCSDSTFACVADASEVQFPVKDPAPYQLAERVGRALPRADLAGATAASARTLGMTAVGLSVLALVGTIGLAVRKASKGA